MCKSSLSASSCRPTHLQADKLRCNLTPPNTSFEWRPPSRHHLQTVFPPHSALVTNETIRSLRRHNASLRPDQQRARLASSIEYNRHAIHLHLHTNTDQRLRNSAFSQTSRRATQQDLRAFGEATNVYDTLRRPGCTAAAREGVQEDPR